MGMQVTPTGQTIYVPDGLLGAGPPQAPADVMPVGTLPTDGQPMPLPGEPQPMTPWMPGQLPPDVASAAQGGFAPPPLPSMPNAQPPPMQPQMPDFIVPPMGAKAPMTHDQMMKYQIDNGSKQVAGQLASQGATPQAMQNQALAGQLGEIDNQKQLTTQQGDINQKRADDIYQAKLADQIEEKRITDAHDMDVAKRQAEQEKLTNDTKQTALAAVNQRIDPNRMWHSMSTGQHVQAGIGILLAGIGQGLNGDKGPNPAMKLITDAIDRDVDAQKANMEQGNKAVEMRRGIATDYSHLTDDKNQQFELRKAEGRYQAAQAVDLAGAKYGSPLAKLQAQMASSALTQSGDALISQFAGTRIAQQHQDAELAVQKQNANTAGYNASIADRTERHSDTYRQQMLARDLMKDQADEQIKREAAAAKAAGKLTGKEAELGMGGTPRAVKNPDGSTGFELPAAMNRNGTPVQFGTKEEAEKIRPMKADTDEAIESIDALRQLREESGPTTDISKSAAWQKEHSRFASIKRAVMGSEAFARASESQQKLVEEQLGKLEDPTRWNGIQPGLLELRRTLVDNLRHTVNSHPGNDYDADAAYPDLVKKADSTADDQLLLRSPTVDEVFGAAETPTDAVGAATASPTIRNAAFKAAGGEHLVSQAQGKKLDGLIDLAFNPKTDPKTAAEAVKQIKDAAEHSQSDGIKARAAHALTVSAYLKAEAGGK